MATAGEMTGECGGGKNPTDRQIAIWTLKTICIVRVVLYSRYLDIQPPKSSDLSAASLALAVRNQTNNII